MCIICANADPNRFDTLNHPHEYKTTTIETIILDVEETDESTDFNASNDVPDDTTTPASLTPGGTYEGEIETAGDVDWIKVTLTAGETYNFVVEGLYNWGGWTLEDPELQLLDSAGNVLSSDSDSGWVHDAQLFFTAANSGDYYLAVSKGTRGPETGTYQIESEIIASDPGSTNATASTLTAGSTVRAAIETTTDSDWFAFSVEAGKEYVITAQGVQSGDANTLSESLMTIRDGVGNILFTSSGTQNDASVEFTASATGTYYIEIEGRNNEIGTYGLNAFEVNLFDNDQIANQLTNGYWGGSQRAWDLSGGRRITVDVTGLDALGQETARYALETWTEALGIEFIEVTSGAQLTFDDEVSGRAYASSSVSGGVISSSTINVGQGWSGVTSFAINNYLTQTYIHEIGHSLGLGHSGNYNGNATYGTDNLYSNDSWQASVMSYFNQNENSYIDASFAYVATPQLADIIAARNLYGFSGTTRTGDDVYGFGNTTGNTLFDDTLTNVSFTIVDDGGTDTIVGSQGQASVISLVAETFSSLNGEVDNVSIARGVVIENATGGDQSDTLIGNSANNILTGGLGDDAFTSNGGINIADGGQGTDILRLQGSTYTDYTVVSIGPAAFLIIDMNLSDGDEGMVFTDSVENYRIGQTTAALNDTGGLNVVEGDATVNTLDGTAARDVVSGLAGADTLYGLGDDDILYGGADNDTLVGGVGADTLVGGSGIDTASYLTAGSGVFASLFLGRGVSGEAAGDVYFGVEGLRGTNFNDILVGRDGATDYLYGGQGSDGLRGNGGDDFMYGEGGADLFFSGFGADTHVGGSGVDTMLFINSNAGVIVRLDLGQGFLGQAEGDSYSGIENVVGSAFGDLIRGDGASNHLQGRGGNDLLIGGNGADVLDGGDGFDTVSFASESAGVTASLFTGAASGGDRLIGIERLVGSNFNDILVGNDGSNDTLEGGGGNDALRGNGGDDTMLGGNGNDLFFSGFGADSHDGGAGVDTVAYHQAGAGVIVNLASGTGAVGQAEGDTYTNIENVVGSAFGDFVVGSAAGNRLEGRAGNDVLDGRAGADVLLGGNGADRFIFKSGYDDDRIGDFTDGDDVLDLTSFGFSSFTQVSALASQQGADTVINFGNGDALRLVNFDLADLDANDVMI